MEPVFLCIVIFLFALAVFDLSVGVSNDAVNFLNSAIGAKAASFKRILLVASIGVFIGAAMSNGMMDIARHGIFHPEHFTFYDIICIFMAVMVTDIFLLDIFNTLGLPTSTTVSMVFELLGATFVVALIKMSSGADASLGFIDYINTEKALTVIIGIFLSVAIAFIFGTIVQFIARLIFSFNYRNNFKWKIGIYGGICTTAIVYFLLIKGVKSLVFMTPDVKEWIASNTGIILLGCLAFFTVFMQLLHIFKVNVLKVIVLLGTFALAMAFAGNDLVNFIGVPVTGFESFNAYTAGGNPDPHSFNMGFLNGPANTPVYFLIIAGLIMVLSLIFSPKVKNVSKTEIGLSSQQGGDEMFGSSRIARRLVRWTLSVISWIQNITPAPVRRWVGSRFNIDETIMEHGAAYDLIRGSVNLVLAGALIALGTSMKLPLSTTFITFMVAMGTSLADRAWQRESAVFRITGVISVIGSWFITAGAAFIGATIVAGLMHFGGNWVMMILAVITIILIIRSNVRFRKKSVESESDVLFNTILTTEDKSKTWPLLIMYMGEQQQKFLTYASETYAKIAQAFINESASTLVKNDSVLLGWKGQLKSARRKETLCLQSVPREVAIGNSAWFYLSNNCCMGILYNLRRINEICREHVDNNFLPLPKECAHELSVLSGKMSELFAEILQVMSSGDIESIPDLRRKCDNLKETLSNAYHSQHEHLHEVDPTTLSVRYVYINMLHETRETISSLRKYLRAYAKLRDENQSTKY